MRNQDLLATLENDVQPVPEYLERFWGAVTRLVLGAVALLWLAVVARGAYELVLLGWALPEVVF